MLHFIFSTQGRLPLIEPEFRDDLFAYLGGVIREMNGTALIVNGATDHVHMLVRVRPVHSAAEIARVVKANSSRWLREKWDPQFAWQTGYGVFSVSESNVAAVMKYIADQEEHHHKRSFQEEFVAFPEEEQRSVRRAIQLGLVSFAPPGLITAMFLRPTACAVGCILSPLRGFGGGDPVEIRDSSDQCGRCHALKEGSNLLAISTVHSDSCHSFETGSRFLYSIREKLTHGLRRGLCSCAASRLTAVELHSGQLSGAAVPTPS